MKIQMKKDRPLLLEKTRRGDSAEQQGEFSYSSLIFVLFCLFLCASLPWGIVWFLP